MAHTSSLSRLTDASDHYEAALLANDLTVLDAYFWQDAQVERIGPEGELQGPEAIRQSRLTWPVADLARDRISRRIVMLGSEGSATGLVSIVFRRTRDGRIGRQTQTWMQIEGAWLIVAAHVSYREI